MIFSYCPTPGHEYPPKVGFCESAVSTTIFVMRASAAVAASIAPAASASAMFRRRTGFILPSPLSTSNTSALHRIRPARRDQGGKGHGRQRRHLRRGRRHVLGDVRLRREVAAQSGAGHFRKGRSCEKAGAEGNCEATSHGLSPQVTSSF